MVVAKRTIVRIAVANFEVRIIVRLRVGANGCFGSAEFGQEAADKCEGGKEDETDR